MAQSYLELFKDSLETQYASGATPTVGMAQLNTSVRVKPLLSEDGSTKGKLQIQRMKRIKGKASPIDGKAGAFGTELTAGLNALTKVLWDTVDVVTGAEEIIGVTVHPNEEMDVLEDATAYSRTIANRIQNVTLSLEEKALEALKGAGVNATKLDLTKPEEVAQAILDSVFEKQELVDDFKAYSDTVVVQVHPRVAKAFADLQGGSYQTGTNTFPEGFKSSFTYNGIEFFVNPLLNAIEGSAATETLGAIVMDREAFVASDLADGLVEFDETYLGERVVGSRHWEAMKVIDASRVESFEFTKAAGKKVNA